MCDLSGIGLYDESMNHATGAYILADDGALNYNTASVYRVEYYPNSQCWEVFSNYSNLLRSLCGTYPTSGAPTVSSEVANQGSQVDGQGPIPVEMPYTIYGSSSPTTNNGLRIKGANGYVPWYSNLSSGATSWYDERNCPNVTYCKYSQAYNVAEFGGPYKIEGYGFGS